MRDIDFRTRLRGGQPVFGAWSLLPGAATAAALGSSGADFVVVDLQHGAAVEADLPALMSAVSVSDATPLVRVRSSTFADIGRPLDLGAQGILVPNVRGSDHVREVLAYCRYGPDGVRSYGRLLGAADDPLCLVVLETAEALADLDQILRLTGVDGVYVGPKDLALSLDRAGPEDELEMSIVVRDVVRRCVDAGRPVGVHVSEGEVACRYRKEGATILTVAVDRDTLMRGVGAELLAAKSGGAADPDRDPDP